MQSNASPNNLRHNPNNFNLYPSIINLLLSMASIGLIDVSSARIKNVIAYESAAMMPGMMSNIIGIH